jgi:hypothetical protein
MYGIWSGGTDFKRIVKIGQYETTLFLDSLHTRQYLPKSLMKVMNLKKMTNFYIK